MMKLVFLGKFRGLVPSDFAREIPESVANLGQLRDWLAQGAPRLAEAIAAARAQIVLNHEIVRDMTIVLRDGDEVAFLPPMSGG